MAIKDGEVIQADEIINNCIAKNFANQAQLLYNSAYIGFNSKLNVATGVPNLKNIKYDVFNSDTATTKTNISYDGTGKTYVTSDLSAFENESEYIVITATSAPTISINDCAISKLQDNKWIVYCTSGTDAVKRAQIIKTLFYGTNGTGAKILEFGSVTAIQTSHTSDVGKRAHYFYTYNHGDSGAGSSSLIGTFTNTSENTDCSSWSYCEKRYNGTTQAISDEMGTNRTSDEQDNPTDCKAEAIAWTGGARWYMPSTNELNVADSIGATNPTTHISRGLVLCVGDITWSSSGTTSNIDFYSDNSIPDFTLAPAISTFVNATLIFQTTSLPTITDCIATWNSSIDSDNTLTVSISADGTNYEEVTDATIHRFTNTGTNLYIKFEIDRVDTSAVDKISEYAILYNVGAS